MFYYIEMVINILKQYITKKRSKTMVDYDKVCDECLKEMFRRVDMEYPNKEFTDQKDWYTKCTWTEKEEADFKVWMKKHLKKRCKHWTEKLIEKEIAMFNLMWGWKTRKEK